MEEAELTCGQELAGAAAIPEQIGALFRHVAINLRRHAEWVGTDDVEARQEHDAMQGVANGYEEISRAADRAASFMRTLAELKPAKHDAARLDQRQLEEWMRVKVQLQRGLSDLLLRHAEESERAIIDLGARRSK